MGVLATFSVRKQGRIVGVHKSNNFLESLKCLLTMLLGRLCNIFVGQVRLEGESEIKVRKVFQLSRKQVFWCSFFLQLFFFFWSLAHKENLFFPWGLHEIRKRVFGWSCWFFSHFVQNCVFWSVHTRHIPVNKVPFIFTSGNSFTDSSEVANLRPVWMGYKSAEEKNLNIAQGVTSAIDIHLPSLQGLLFRTDKEIQTKQSSARDFCELVPKWQ